MKSPEENGPQVYNSFLLGFKNTLFSVPTQKMFFLKRALFHYLSLTFFLICSEMYLKIPNDNIFPLKYLSAFERNWPVIFFLMFLSGFVA